MVTVTLYSKYGGQKSGFEVKSVQEKWTVLYV